MYINRKQTLLIFYIFYYTFVFLVSILLSGNVTNREPQVCVEEGDKVCPPLQVTPGGGSVPRQPQPHPPPHPSAPRCFPNPGAFSSLWLSRPTVLTGKVGICRSQRLPGLPVGGEAVGRAPGSVCLLGSLLPVPRTLATASATGLGLPPASGKGPWSCLATEKSPKPPAARRRGLGAGRCWRSPGPGLRDPQRRLG